MLASLHNPQVKHLVRLRENKKYRQLHNSVLISGKTLINEISRSLEPKKIYFDVTSEPPPFPQSVPVSHAVLKKITGLASPEPIAAEFPLPPSSSLAGVAPILALDAIRDPGNLGTLIRSALAFDWGGVFLLPTCVDLFHEKVIRAARGAPFRLPWKIGSWEELEHLKRQDGFVPYVADLNGQEIDEVTSSSKAILLMSNESEGVSQTGGHFGQKIKIPMRGDMESLNVAVAGSILMYGLRSQ